MPHFRSPRAIHFSIPFSIPCLTHSSGLFNCRMVLVFLVSFIATTSYGQQFGGNPPSVKWQQVNTPVARIIFPKHLDSAATRISSVISYLNSSTENSLGNKHRKINLVLQNQTTISNGYVNLGPFRSEFFLTPLQNSFELGSLPWIDQLTIHEFRHVQQYNNFDVGLSHLFKVVLGDEGQALANNAAIPNWFFEGDAVFSETNLTMQGRGRLAFFHNAFRSLWLADKKYSWMKLRNGSYRDFVPGDYALGYLMVAYGNQKYGADFWKNVTRDAAAFKGLFYPFQNAIKKYTGKSHSQFREDALNYYKNNFELNNENRKTSSSRENVINEEYPAFVDDTSVVYIRSSYKEIPSFVMRKGKHDKKIRVKDVSLDNHFSYRNGKIVYASYQPNPRWANLDYSNLQVLDLESGRQKTITHRAKYFSPDISDDGTKVVAVEVSPQGGSLLHILNAANGNLLTSIPNPTNLFYTYPKFYGNKIISAVRNSVGEMSLALVDTSLGNTEYLAAFSYNVIGFPHVNNDTLYFSAAYGNEDRLFAIALKTKKIFLLHSSLMANGLGSYQASSNNNRIVWTGFTANGYTLQQAGKTDLLWQEINADQLAKTKSAIGINNVIVDSPGTGQLDAIPNKNAAVSKYSKTFKLLNFHSIKPLVNDPDYTITVVGENILNTLQTQASFTYNRAEQWKQIGFSTVYGALFPHLSGGVNYTMDRRGRYRGKTVYWNELEPYAGYNIPLNLSKGRSLRFMNMGSNYVYNQSDFKGVYKDTLGRFSYSYLSNYVTFSNQIQKAKQNIYPRFAQSISLGYKGALTSYKGSQFVANGNLYLPGFLTNHNIVLNGAYLIKDTLGRLNFSSGFPFSRGYQAENLHKMSKWGVNYHLPLLYPDAGLANIIYLLRVRANLFYDHTHVNDFLSDRKPFVTDFRSTGAELYFDTKWWNEAAVTFGIRYSYLLDNDLFGATGKNRWELILPFNLFDQ